MLKGNGWSDLQQEHRKDKDIHVNTNDIKTLSFLYVYSDLYLKTTYIPNINLTSFSFCNRLLLIVYSDIQNAEINPYSNAKITKTDNVSLRSALLFSEVSSCVDPDEEAVPVPVVGAVVLSLPVVEYCIFLLVYEIEQESFRFIFFSNNLSGTPSTYKETRC